MNPQERIETLSNHNEQDNLMVDSNQLKFKTNYNEKVNDGSYPSSEDLNKKDIRRTGYRFIMLAMTCCFMIGNYFCQDNPSVLQDTLEKQFGIDDNQFAWLLNAYTFPNMLLPLFGGIILDKIGMSTGLILFTTVLTLGQFVFALAPYFNQVWYLYAGRFIFGFGGENMSVAQSAIISQWFKGKELNLALGLTLTMSRAGSVLNANLVPSIAQNNLTIALFTGFFICVFSWLNGMGMVILNRKAEKSDPSSKVKLTEEEKFKFSDIAQFKLPFWFLTGSCIFTYMSVFPYYQLASKMIQMKYGFNEDQAGKLIAIPYYISAGFSPLFGFTVDKIGRRVIFITISSIILISAFSLSMLMPSCIDQQCYNEVYPLILIGFGYSLYASVIWGSIPYTVDASTVGTAFGIVTAIQNIGLFVSPLVATAIINTTSTWQDSNFGYFYMDAYFIMINIVGLILNIVLYFMDIKYYDGILNKVDKEDQLDELISSPVPGMNKTDYLKKSLSKSRASQQLVQYKIDQELRASLRRSIATKRPYQ